MLSRVMRGVLVVSSSPVEGELTWHLSYRLYAQCVQKGPVDVTVLLQ